MCLLIDKNQKAPWNKNEFRWKIFKVYKDSKTLLTPYTGTPIRSGWMTAKYDKNYGDSEKSRASQFGFHVFVSREAAREEKKLRNFMRSSKFHDVVRKVIVRGHLKSGHFCGHAGYQKSETWKQMKVVDY